MLSKKIFFDKEVKSTFLKASFCMKNKFSQRKCHSKDLIWLHGPDLTYTVMYCQHPHNSSHCPKTALAKPGEINGKNLPITGAGAIEKK